MADDKYEGCCSLPFFSAEITAEGNVFGCSEAYSLQYSFGNIYEQSFDEIWNSEKALNFRRQFIDGNFKYCNFHKCTQKIYSGKKPEITAPYPKRAQLYLNKDNSKIKKHLYDAVIPALKNVKLMNIHPIEDIFENQYASELINEIVKIYPEIKFTVYTNGVKCDKKHLEKYNLLDRTLYIIFTVKDDKNFKKVLENVKYIGSLRKEQMLKQVQHDSLGRQKDIIPKKFIINIHPDALNEEKLKKIKTAAEESGAEFKFIKSEKKVCRVPFTEMNIDPLGDVFTCCPAFVNHYKIGNIWENGNIEEIWRSPAAEKLREQVFNGDYSLCDLNICVHRRGINESALIEPRALPKKITLAYDRECNLYCLTCRDVMHRNTKEQKEKFAEIYSIIQPLLKDLDEIVISGAGEAFFSSHSRELIKKIAAENKNIVWSINTNGLLFNNANMRALGIYGRINNVCISFPAVSREIYDKIIRGNDYDTVVKNIKNAAFEHNYKKTIKNITINSVISVLNYKEIPALVKFAKENNINIGLSQFCWWGAAEFGRDFKQVSVWDKSHPEFKKFQKILRHPALDYDKLSMSPIFAKIREKEI